MVKTTRDFEQTMQFVIIGIDINYYFTDTEQRTGCECGTQRLVVSRFVNKRDGLRNLWHSPVSLATNAIEKGFINFFFVFSVRQMALSDLSFILLFV